MSSPSLVAHLQAGLTKALRLECNALHSDCIRYLIEDSYRVPLHQRDWKIGLTFSWHYVKNVEYRVAQLVHSIEVMTMAGKNKRKGRSNAFDQYTFVRCELRAEDKKSAKVWIEENATEIGALIHDAVASDYKFSLSFSADHDTFTASLTGKEDNALNPFKTLTARHKDWQVAALTLFYKANVMFKNGVWESDDEDEDNGWA